VRDSQCGFRAYPVELLLRLSPRGERYEFEVEVGVTGNVFGRGHRLRLEVSSSNFPRFDRNLNTGGHPTHDRATRQARQAVEHCRRWPSHLVLPVIPPR
jgi:putative CocE/NonD family hydrolase